MRILFSQRIIVKIILFISLLHPMSRKHTVVVGMSGGVDSSVAALLMKQQGYNVIGMFMKNWEDDDGESGCTATQDFADVVRVCEQIDIPYYSVNFAQEYRDNVFSYFLEDLRAGHTPNPDILCNREIKFKVFLQKALDLGADYLATGHYSRILDGKLQKAEDGTKDQSYFLYTLNKTILGQIIFPLGDLQKTEVRALARRYGLATSEKKDSTGICFIGKRDFRSFLHGYIAYEPGNFEDPNGNVIGRHLGVAYYTIGQRKGLEIGGPGEAWFVLGKDVKRNVVIIAQGADHPGLYTTSLVATEASWVAELPPESLPYRCHAKVRYRQADQPCTITHIEKNRVFVTFDVPQRAVTPRQAIVFYHGDICLGGASIEQTLHP